MLEYSIICGVLYMSTFDIVTDHIGRRYIKWHEII